MLTQRFDIVSFDLFSTLIYIDRELFDFSEATKKVVKMFNGALNENIQHELFEKLYLQEMRSQLSHSPPFKEINSYTFMKSLLNEKFNINISEDHPKLLKQAVNSYFDDILNSTYLVSGAIDVLEHLNDKCIPIVLTSDHAHSKNGWDILEKQKITHYFEKIVFSGDIGFRKPNPIIFDKSMGNGYEKSKTVHIGDNFLVDIMGIIGWGGKGIWVENERFKPEQESFLKNTNVLGVIKKFKELISIL